MKGFQRQRTALTEHVAFMRSELAEPPVVIDSVGVTDRCREI